MQLHQKFPSLYKSLLNEILDQEVPEEDFANCQDCHLCKTKKTSHYLSKCCTYHPRLPNYIVGGILSDDESSMMEGKSRINLKIENKIGVTPYGINAPDEFMTLIKQRRSEGKLFLLKEEERLKLTCPYLDNGNCSIWKYRSELCMTYFCNSVGGLIGKKYWDNLFQFIIDMERKLSQYAMIKTGYPVRKLKFKEIDIDQLSVLTKEGIFAIKRYNHVWDKWNESQRDFYISCYHVIKDLSHAETMEVLGWESQQRLAKLDEILQEFKKNIVPDMLILDQHLIIDESNPAIVSISKGTNKIQLNRRKYLGLKQFDGTKSTYDILRSGFGLLSMSSIFVQRMYQEGFLCEVTN